MAIKNRTDLKSYFVKNAIPTEGNFADLIDSQLNQAPVGGDGVFKPDGEALSVVAAPGDQKRVLRLYANYPAANPDWLISLNPATAGTSRAGFGVTDGTGNTRLFIDASTGQIGVATNAPQFALDVVGGARANGFRGRYDLVLNDYRTANPAANVCLHSPPGDRDTWIYRDVADSGTNWGIYHRQIDTPVAGLPGNSIGFVGGGGSKLQAYVNLADGSGFFAGGLSVQGNVTASGAVGIGTSSPATGYKLDVHGYNMLTDAEGKYNCHFPSTDNNAYVTGNNVYLRGGAPTGWNIVLTATSGGRVGIGTTSPEASLHVTSGSRFTGDRHYFADSEGKGRVRVGAAWGVPGLYSEDNQDIVIGCAGGRTVHLGQPNQVRVLDGVLSAPGGVIFEGEVPHIDRDGALYRSGGQCYLTVDDHLFIRHTGTGANWAAHFDTNSGNLELKGAAVHVSDLRLKQNIEPVVGSLAKLRQLRCVSFDWKDGTPSTAVSKNLGFIAQEVREAVPEAVVEASGNLLGIAYNALTALLVEAVKEQQKQIDELHAALRLTPTR